MLPTSSHLPAPLPSSLLLWRSTPKQRVLRQKRWMLTCWKRWPSGELPWTRVVFILMSVRSLIPSFLSCRFPGSLSLLVGWSQEVWASVSWCCGRDLLGWAAPPPGPVLKRPWQRCCWMEAKGTQSQTLTGTRLELSRLPTTRSWLKGIPFNSSLHICQSHA